MKMIIRNLARTTTETELKSLFTEFGTVLSCSLVTDKNTGESKGFGFVTMAKPGEAKSAMKNLNNKKIANSTIRVKKADAQSAPTPPKPTVEVVEAPEAE